MVSFCVRVSYGSHFPAFISWSNIRGLFLPVSLALETFHPDSKSLSVATDS